MKIKNYRGVRQATIVIVLEGNGTENSPYEEVRYVIAIGDDGVARTIGKIIDLQEDEKNFSHI